MAWVAGGSIAQWPEHLQLKQEVLGLIPGGFFSSSWLTTVDGMKDLWCSSTNSAAINIDMNGRVCDALVQFGCCQHKHK